MNVLKPLWLACALLTTLPVSQWIRMPVTPVESGRSVACYPVVGLLLGGLLALAALGLHDVSSLLAAALLLTVWIGLTGALHLDGLADAADAWFAGHADRTRTLTVMKDPAAGPMAVTVLIVVLLLKFAALATLLATPGLAAPATVLAAALVARAAAAGFMVVGRYVRAQGIASAQTASLPTAAVWLSTIVSATLALVLLCFLSWLVALAVAVAGFIFIAIWRAAWQRRIGGYTGDVVGALIECMETLVVVVVALGVGSGGA